MLIAQFTKSHDPPSNPYRAHKRNPSQSPIIGSLGSPVVPFCPLYSRVPSLNCIVYQEKGSLPLLWRGHCGTYVASMSTCPSAESKRVRWMVSCLPWPLQTSWHANARLSTKCMEFVQAGGVLVSFWQLQGVFEGSYGSYRKSWHASIRLTVSPGS